MPIVSDETNVYTTEVNGTAVYRYKKKGYYYFTAFIEGYAIECCVPGSVSDKMVSGAEDHYLRPFVYGSKDELGALLDKIKSCIDENAKVYK